MRIPIPIVILSCVLAIGIVWYVGTHNKDFLASPTPEDLVDAAKEWEESIPNIPPPKPINPALRADPDNHKPLSPKTPEKAVVENLPLGNLQVSPALSEYGAHGDKGADSMIHLATLLETKGQLQRSLLAWERVIDASNPSDEQRAMAAASIRRLKTSLSPWNPDTGAELLITLRAGATLKEEKLLTGAMQKAADTINQTSGYILRVESKASIGKARSSKTPRIPVAIWFSRQKDDTGATAETPPISFMADPTQQKMLVAQIEAGIYALVRSHLANTTNFSPLPEYPSGAKPNELLQLHITRLMWREFATSMND